MQLNQQQELVNNTQKNVTSSGLWGKIDSAINNQKTRPVDPFSNNTNAQLTAYLNSPVADRETNCNPIAVWQTIKHGLENLNELAKEFLIIPATSTSSERLFSHAGQIACQLRSNTSAGNVNRRIFLRSVPEKFWFEED